jgi:hypothetical protein
VIGWVEAMACVVNKGQGLVKLDQWEHSKNKGFGQLDHYKGQ